MLWLRFAIGVAAFIALVWFWVRSWGTPPR